MVNFIIFENLSFDFCSPGLAWPGWMDEVYGRAWR